MKQVLIIFQLIVSALLIGTILLQKRGSALGSVFGGSGESYFSRRGLEKKIFWTSCILVVLFVFFSLLNIIL